MKTAILIPLYKPAGRHILLLKSVISAAAAIEGGALICAAADGPESHVTWPQGSIEGLVQAAADRGLQLRLTSVIRAQGYPGCYIRMLAEAISQPDVEYIHLIDQDDYCLPGRFTVDSRGTVVAGSCIIVDTRFQTLGKHQFEDAAHAALLETPSPGMTFSLHRSVAAEYLAILDEDRFRSIPHDFVIAQLALARRALYARSCATMLYVQHQNNALGYLTGSRWLFRRAREVGSALRRTWLRASLLDRIYGNDRWFTLGPLHRKRYRHMIYRVLMSLRSLCS